MNNQAKTKPKTATEKLQSEKDALGRVQPQALFPEEAVLGALMLDRECFDIVSDILKPESFYKEAHSLIYQAISRLAFKYEPVDLLTVTEELSKMGELEKIGGGYYLVELSNRVASAANVEYHARIIAQKYIQRQLISTGSLCIQDAYDDTVDVFELLERTEENLFKIHAGQITSEITMPTLGSRYMVELEKRSKHKGLIGIPSGIESLDSKTGGWQKKDLIILAGRPSMGKTAAALTVALNAALDYGKPVGFFSLEMGDIQLYNRLVSNLADVDGESLQSGKLLDAEWQRVQTAVERLNGTPLYIDETPSISIMALRAKARRMVQKHGVSLIIVDYLQLMTATGENGQKVGNREQEVSAISRGLKGIAKSLDVPVIALAQLSRAVETRGGSKRPQLSDLRESGGIEADADIIGFLYRPEYYQILEDEQGRSLKGLAEIIIAKNRNGALETILTKFEPKYTRFLNYDPNATDEKFPTVDTFQNLVAKNRPVLTDVNGYVRDKEEEEEEPPF